MNAISLEPKPQCKFWHTCPVHCKAGRPRYKPNTKKKVKPRKIIDLKSVTMPSFTCNRYSLKLLPTFDNRGFQKFKDETGNRHQCIKIIGGKSKVCHNLISAPSFHTQPTNP